MTPRVIVFGAGGQVGRAVAATAPAGAGLELRDEAAVDIRDEAAVRAAATDAGATVIVASHELDRTDALATRFAEINGGHVVATGGIREAREAAERVS